MRKAAISIAVALAFPAMAQASDSYVVRLTILNAKGMQEFDMNNGAHYSTLSECLLRRKAWERDELPGYQAALDKARKQGQTAEMTVECKHLD